MNENKYSKLSEEIINLLISKLSTSDYMKVTKEISDLEMEIDRLNNIIKEIREYIEKNLAKDDNGCGCWWYSFEYYVNAKKELLGILDKEKE